MEFKHVKKTMRDGLKHSINGLCLIAVLPLVLVYQAMGFLCDKDGCFWAFSQFISLVPGKTGNYIRKNFYRFTMIRCDKDCAISFGTTG